MLRRSCRRIFNCLARIGGLGSAAAGCAASGDHRQASAWRFAGSGAGGMRALSLAAKKWRARKLEVITLRENRQDDLWFAVSLLKYNFLFVFAVALGAFIKFLREPMRTIPLREELRYLAFLLVKSSGAALCHGALLDLLRRPRRATAADRFGRLGHADSVLDVSADGLGAHILESARPAEPLPHLLHAAADAGGERALEQSGAGPPTHGIHLPIWPWDVVCAGDETIRPGLD